jgi:acid phosphatase (class A)
LSNLLPPPPAAGSTAARDDLETVLQVQRTRSPQEMAAAKADKQQSGFRFADALGADLQPEALPKTAAFFARVAKFDKSQVQEAKMYWHRPRPSAVSSQVHPLSPEKPDDWSYPSGHATFGYSSAALLATMLPERRAQIFARADLYAQHRIVMGAHFPTDIEAGKVAGIVLAQEILSDPQWQADYAAARAELRHALGMP